MNEEEAIKKRLMEQRTAEYSAAASQALQQEVAKQILKAELKSIMLKILEPKARERLSNLKITKPQIAMQLEIYLAQLYQAGQLKKVTDEQIVAILKKLTRKPDFRIKMK